MDEDQIYKKLLETKIQSLQIDPFGYCNNKCWYCPVKYLPNPRIYRRHMPIDLLDHILGQFVAAKGSITAANFWHVWCSHYNEMLLYRYFADFMGLLDKYKLSTTILSNGTTLTDRNIQIIYDAVKSGTVAGMCFNIPTIIPETYAAYVGRPPEVCVKMVAMLHRLVDKLMSIMETSRFVSIVVNGQSDEYRNLLGRNAPRLPAKDLEAQFLKIKEEFPNVNVYRSGWLFDRAGLLSKFGVLDHSPLFLRPDEVVAGCTNSFEDAGRQFGWAHVNALGELFLCCCDYNYEYSFGNLATKSLSELWYSKDHVKMLMCAMDGICRTCCSALKG